MISLPLSAPRGLEHFLTGGLNRDNSTAQEPQRDAGEPGGADAARAEEGPDAQDGGDDPREGHARRTACVGDQTRQGAVVL
jgi:hypothetical protein